MTSIRASRDYSGSIVGLLHLRNNNTSHVLMRRRIILSIAAFVLIVSLWGPGYIFRKFGGSSLSTRQRYDYTDHTLSSTATTSIQRQEEQELIIEIPAMIREEPTTMTTPSSSTAEDESTNPEQPVSKLECRASVMEFVINASDQKDECDGLRRAFVTACTNLDMAGQIFAAANPQNQNLIKVNNNPNLDYVNPQIVDSHGTNRPGGRRNTNNNIKFIQTDTQQQQQQQPAADGLSYDDDKVITSNNIRQRQRLLTPEIPSSTASTNPVLLQQSYATTTTAATTTAHQQQQLAAQVSQQHHSTLYSHAQSILDSPESIEARTCCASIMNVFHEHCDRNEEVEYTDRSLFVIVSVIAMCSIVKSLIKHFEIRWLPEAAGCILVGVILGSILDKVPNIHYSFDGSLFLRVMLPFIVFHAALSIDKHSLYMYVFPIALYAVVGTLLSSALVALFIYIGTGFGMPLVESCIFGALISSIDPIAVLSILQSIGMTTTDAIYVIIFGESLFNDGIAIVLYETLVEFLDESIAITTDEIVDSCVEFLVVILGSIAVGVLCGGFCTLYFYSMEGCQTPLVEVLIFLCWALIPYYICDGVSWSGIVGIVAAGIVMDLFVVGYHDQQQSSSNSTSSSDHNGGGSSNFHRHGNTNSGSSSGNNNTPWPSSSRENSSTSCDASIFQRIFSRNGHMSDVARNHVGFVSEIFATLMETAIFAYLGLFLLSSRYKWNLYLTTLAILSCLVSRAVMIPILSFVANRIKARSGSTTTRLPCLNKNYATASSNDDDIDNQFGNFEGRSATTSTSGVNRIIDQRMQIVLWFGGLRGAMSFALVENIPLYDASTGYGSRLKPELKAMTSASIIFTIFICGGTTFYLLERLGMAFNLDSEMVEMTSPLTSNKTSNCSLDDNVKTSPVALVNGGSSSLNGSSSNDRNSGRDIKLRLR